jgi:alanine dehydrogenase
VIIGLPEEIKDNEYRVGLTPAGVRALTDADHRVLVEKTAGEGSGSEDSLTLAPAPPSLIQPTMSGLKAR